MVPIEMSTALLFDFYAHHTSILRRLATIRNAAEAKAIYQHVDGKAVEEVDIAVQIQDPRKPKTENQ